jgi:hypothetical protein
LSRRGGLLLLQPCLAPLTPKSGDLCENLAFLIGEALGLQLVKQGIGLRPHQG